MENIFTPFFLILISFFEFEHCVSFDIYPNYLYLNGLRKQRMAVKKGEWDEQRSFLPSNKKGIFFGRVSSTCFGCEEKREGKETHFLRTKVTTQQFLLLWRSVQWEKDPLLSCLSSEKLQVVTEDKCDQLTPEHVQRNFSSFLLRHKIDIFLLSFVSVLSCNAKNFCVNFTRSSLILLWLQQEGNDAKAFFLQSRACIPSKLQMTLIKAQICSTEKKILFRSFRRKIQINNWYRTTD